MKKLTLILLLASCSCFGQTKKTFADLKVGDTINFPTIHGNTLKAHPSGFGITGFSFDGRGLKKGLLIMTKKGTVSYKGCKHPELLK